MSVPSTPTPLGAQSIWSNFSKSTLGHLEHHCWWTPHHLHASLGEGEVSGLYANVIMRLMTSCHICSHAVIKSVTTCVTHKMWMCKWNTLRCGWEDFWLTFYWKSPRPFSCRPCWTVCEVQFECAKKIMSVISYTCWCKCTCGYYHTLI